MPQLTPLHALHSELGAKFVTFAGFTLPLQYRQGIIQEHLFTRAAASLFDVSHMGQITIEGPPAALEGLVPSDIAGLPSGRQRYTVLTNEAGGIIDDIIVTRLADKLHVVVNAAFTAQDYAHLCAALPGCAVTLHADRALLALQGPAAASVLTAFDARINVLGFMSAAEFDLCGVRCLISRSGYTGEDGFEISLPAQAATAIARKLLDNASVEPAGLGARNSLRLEAGLCLAGTDIDATTTPIEAGLSWVIAKKYRAPAVAEARFPGAKIILNQLSVGSATSRVGLRSQGRIPLHGGMILHSEDGKNIGRITSGSFAPSIGAPLAMGYVNRGAVAPGTSLVIAVREREHRVIVTGLPFMPARHHRI